MTVTCTVYGLGLQIDRPLPALVGLPPADRIDLRIEFDPTTGPVPPPDSPDRPFYVSADRDDQDRPRLRAFRTAGGRGLRVAFADGTHAELDHAGTWLRACTPAGSTLDDTASYVLGPLLGLVLRLRGIPCLHASAVAVDGRAVALVGPSGAGKSSTAAAFAQLGHPVLSDDVAALAETGAGFLVQPAYPRIRLWPEAAEGLFGRADALPAITPTWDKRYLDLNRPDLRFQREPLPLAAVYWLGERLAQPAPTRIEPVRPAEALVSLVAEAYATQFQDRALRAREFDVLGRLVAQVPVRRLVSGSDLRRIPDRAAAILADLRGGG